MPRYRPPPSIVPVAWPKGDVKRINDIAVRAPCTGMIIVGGGLVKHHVCNANLMRNGADFAVFMNTGKSKKSLVCTFAFPCVYVLSTVLAGDGLRPR